MSLFQYVPYAGAGVRAAYDELGTLRKNEQALQIAGLQEQRAQAQEQRAQEEFALKVEQARRAAATAETARRQREAVFNQLGATAPSAGVAAPSARTSPAFTTGVQPFVSQPAAPVGSAFETFMRSPATPTAGLSPAADEAALRAEGAGSPPLTRPAYLGMGTGQTTQGGVSTRVPSANQFTVPEVNPNDTAFGQLTTQKRRDALIRDKIEEITQNIRGGKYGVQGGVVGQFTGGIYDYFATPAPQAETNAAARDKATQALTWLRSDTAREYFGENPDALNAMSANPIRFFELNAAQIDKNFGAKTPSGGARPSPAVTVQTATGEPLTIDLSRPAETDMALAAPGLAVSTPSADLAGSIASTQPGTRIEFPQTNTYVVNEAARAFEQQKLANAERNLRLQLAAARAENNLSSAIAVSAKLDDVRLSKDYLTGEAALSNLLVGDPQPVAEFTYKLTDGKMRIAQDTNGTYNILFEDRPVAVGLDEQGLFTQLRGVYDQNFRQQQAEHQGKIYELSLERYKEDIKNMSKAEADAMLEGVKATLKQQNPQAEVKEMADGSIVLSFPDGTVEQHVPTTTKIEGVEVATTIKRKLR